MIYPLYPLFTSTLTLSQSFWNGRKRLKLYDYFPTVEKKKRKNLPLIIQILGTKDIRQEKCHNFSRICSKQFPKLLDTTLIPWKREHLLKCDESVMSNFIQVSKKKERKKRNSKFERGNFWKSSILEMKSGGKKEFYPFCVSCSEARSTPIRDPLPKNRCTTDERRMKTLLTYSACAELFTFFFQSCARKIPRQSKELPPRHWKSRLRAV